MVKFHLRRLVRFKKEIKRISSDLIILIADKSPFTRFL